MPKHNKKPKKINYSPENLYQLTVYAWGVDPTGASKLKHQIGVKLFGGNVGHASIGVCFPADKRGKELIHKYCENDDQSIPYRKITKLNKMSNGEITKTSYYEVYFSVYPESKHTPISLQTMLDDKIVARVGIHHDYRRNVPSVLGMTNYSDADIDSRTIRGLLGIKKQITLPPLIVVSDQKYEVPYVKTILEKFKNLDVSIRKYSNDTYKLRLEYKKLIKSLQLDREIKQVLLNPTEDTSKKNKDLSHLDEKTKQDILNLEQHISKKNMLCFRLWTTFKKLYEKNSSYNLDRYIKIGKPADGQCNLPIVDSLNKDHHHKSGLELEEMLKTMRSIADDQEKFNLYKKNCSSTVLTILNSGIREQDRKWMAKHVPKVKEYYDESAWIFKMLTPQSVYNAATSIEKRIMRKEGITPPIQALIKNPTPIKKFMEGLKFIKKLFINGNKAYKLIAKVVKDIVKKEETSLFFSFCKDYKKTNNTDEKTSITKPKF